MYVGSVPGLPSGVMDDVVAPPLINGDDMPRKWWYPYGAQDKRNHTKPQLCGPRCGQSIAEVKAKVAYN